MPSSKKADAAPWNDSTLALLVHGYAWLPNRMRRSVGGGTGEALPRAREAITVAARSMDHLRSMTRTLDYALDSGELGGLLDERIDVAATELERVQRQERTSPRASAAAHAPQGTLLTDAGRLLADIRSGWQSIAST
ncbi:hypothetical protein [Streptomyces virginiae]|uniref:hypothetical protein n=1 Tax=Streptomyces virginiae TaxID=1961 RepID=UPI002DBA64D6|nr:hypothetical protein [Streptomyces sp. CMAA1738]MEC4574625.1 hypothetical protein [Streptomyces sp. CMAA1738]